MKLSLFLQKPGFFAKTGNLQNLGIFCKNREFTKSRDFLQKPGIYKIPGFFAKTGNLQNLGIFCKNRDFLQKQGIFTGFLYKITRFLLNLSCY